MSLFGSLMADVEDDPFFGSHMRHMRQMNNMMNSMFSDPFGMLSGGLGGLGGHLAIAGPQHGGSLMPFMPQMPSLNRLFSGDLNGGMGHGSSFSSSTVVMSSGPNGKPQVYSSTSSTKIGPYGVKETRKTLQDSRTGTKKMSIGHHIGERAHLIEREQNYYSGDQEERQEFINLEEDDAEQFDREFQEKAGAYTAPSRARITDVPRRAEPLLALPAPPTPNRARITDVPRREEPLALPAPPAPKRNESFNPKTDLSSAIQVKPYLESKHSLGRDSERRPSSVSSSHRPSARRPLRTTFNPISVTIPNSSASVREVYSGAHPQRHRHKHHHKANRHAQNDH